MLLWSLACEPAVPAKPDPGDGVGTVTDVYEEVCNGLDDDGDGEVDEDAVDASDQYRDDDHDGYGDGEATVRCPGRGWSSNDDDCHDGFGWVNPAGSERCGGGIDEDCDGRVNEDGAEGCVEGWTDTDGDGSGTGDVRCRCDWEDEGPAATAGDCDDDDPHLTDDCTTGPVATLTVEARITEVGGSVVAVADTDGDGTRDAVLSDAGGPYRVVEIPVSGDRTETDATKALVATIEDRWSLVGIATEAPIAVVTRSIEESCGEETCAQREEFAFYPGPWTQTEAEAAALVDLEEAHGSGASSSFAGDIDADGGADVVYGRSGTTEGFYLWIVPGDESRTLTDADLLAGTTGTDFQGGLADVGDLDGDGFDELFVRGLVFTGPVAAPLDVLSPDWSVSVAGDVSAADVDGDGTPELIGADSPGVGVYSAAGTPVAYVGREDDRSDFYDVADPYDADGDGRADLFFGGPVEDTRSAAYLFAGPVTGTWDATQATARWYGDETTGISAEGLLDGSLLVRTWTDTESLLVVTPLP